MFLTEIVGLKKKEKRIKSFQDVLLCHPKQKLDRVFTFSVI